MNSRSYRTMRTFRFTFPARKTRTKSATKTPGEYGQRVKNVVDSSRFSTKRRFCGEQRKISGRSFPRHSLFAIDMPLSSPFARDRRIICAALMLLLILLCCRSACQNPTGNGQLISSVFSLRLPVPQDSCLPPPLSPYSAAASRRRPRLHQPLPGKRPLPPTKERENCAPNCGPRKTCSHLPVPGYAVAMRCERGRRRGTFFGATAATPGTDTRRAPPAPAQSGTTS